MRRAVVVAGGLLALAAAFWRAARPAPPAAVSGVASGAPELPAEARAKLATLRDILRSRNDNDPRLDTDFNNLTPADKSAFEAEYARIPPEKRNERGTIVFLLAQNIATPADWAFLSSVVGEPPCRSLADCSQAPRPGGENEDVGDDVTLAYPALVALKGAEGALAASRQSHRPPPPRAWSLVQEGRASKVGAIRRLADRIARDYGGQP